MGGGFDRPTTAAPQVYSTSDLNHLYSAHVKFAGRFNRPLELTADEWVSQQLFYHSAVKVILENGQKFLIQKGNEYGQPSGTTVVDAKVMNDLWWSTGEAKVITRSTVGDFVMAGGENYNVLTDNCHHAAKRMMQPN